MSKPLTNKNGEVRELSGADFLRAKPMKEVLPQVAAAYRKSRGRPKGSNKTPISLRLDDDILAFFRAKGTGWQTRINEALRTIVDVTQR